MATPNLTLINALRTTAKKLQDPTTPYQWGHMGTCNCGHLAQTLTTKTQAQIHQLAMARYGDWHEQTHDFCPVSGLPMDSLIAEIMNAGLSIDDFRHLERLSDEKILRQLPIEKRYLQHNLRNDVVLYLKTWADLLQQQLLDSMPVPNIEFTHQNTEKIMDYSSVAQ